MYSNVDGLQCKAAYFIPAVYHLSPLMRKTDLVYSKRKTQISCAVTAQQFSTFVFVIQTVEFLFYSYPKFQASSLLL